MLVNVNELSGNALNWAVAMARGMKIENPEDVEYLDHADWVLIDGEVRNYWEVSSYSMNRAYDYTTFTPNEDWLIAGQLLAQLVADGFEVKKLDFSEGVQIFKVINDHVICASGPTLQIAACRCFVLTQFGPKVKIPQELL